MEYESQKSKTKRGGRKNMIHILVLTKDPCEKAVFAKRVQSSLNTLCSVKPGLTTNIYVKDINIQVTSVVHKTGDAIGDIHLQPDYYIDDSGVSLSDILSDLCRGAERLKGVVDVVSVVKNRDHYAKHEAYNRI